MAGLAVSQSAVESTLTTGEDVRLRSRYPAHVVVGVTEIADDAQSLQTGLFASFAHHVRDDLLDAWHGD
jgi:hypothetical protein